MSSLTLNPHTIQPFLQTHLKNIYSCVALSALAACTGGFAHFATGLGGFWNIVPCILFLVDLLKFPETVENTKTKLVCLLLFAFFCGLGSGPLLDEVVATKPDVITTAFLGTSLIFACLTLSSMFNDGSVFVHLGCTLLYFLSSMFLANIPNFLKGSSYRRFKKEIFKCVGITSSHFVCNSQMFMSARRNGDSDFVLHSAVLFLHFITIFQCLLFILIDRTK